MNAKAASDRANNSPLVFPLTIYFDAACPLCASEMRTLKAADTEGRLVLVDCSAPGFDDASLAACGVSREAMLARIHARDAAGRWLDGVEVFEAAYGAAGFSALARLWGSKRLRPCWDRVYPWIARRRYLLSRLGFTCFFRLLSFAARDRATEVPAAGKRDCQSGACRQSVPHKNRPG